jgi:hypothetical protein
LDYVQTHECSWGNDTYQNKPELEQILRSPVVAFWQPMGSENDSKNKRSDRYIATLHKDLDELEDYFSKLLFRALIEPPKQRIIKIFASTKPVQIKGVRIQFEVSER